MNHPTHAVTLVTSAFPFITKAIQALLYDNGVVNRGSDGVEVMTLQMWKKVRERYEGEESVVIDACEAELAALSDYEFEEVTIGEGLSTTTVMLDQFLNFIFESL